MGKRHLSEKHSLFWAGWLNHQVFCIRKDWEATQEFLYPFFVTATKHKKTSRNINMKRISRYRYQWYQVSVNIKKHHSWNISRKMVVNFSKKNYPIFQGSKLFPKPRRRCLRCMGRCWGPTGTTNSGPRLGGIRSNEFHRIRRFTEAQFKGLWILMDLRRFRKKQRIILYHIWFLWNGIATIFSTPLPSPQVKLSTQDQWAADVKVSSSCSSPVHLEKPPWF